MSRILRIVYFLSIVIPVSAIIGLIWEKLASLLWYSFTTNFRVNLALQCLLTILMMTIGMVVAVLTIYITDTGD